MYMYRFIFLNLIQIFFHYDVAAHPNCLDQWEQTCSPSTVKTMELSVSSSNC